jgi:toxin FitB
VKYLLDTNVVSELISRQPNAKVVAWVDALDAADVYLSVLTLGELRKGIEKLPPSQRKEEISAWLNSDLLPRFAGNLVEISADVALVWGELTGRLEREGRPMPAIDSLIAASALAGKLTLVTRNETDFEHAGGDVVNPWTM